MKTQPAKVVARYADGRVLKGTTLNFSPSRDLFSLHLLGAAPDTEPQGVALRELKAVFFVRDFDGNAVYNERKLFERRPVGRAITVAFMDGEELVGSSVTFDDARTGFFLFPADPASNNERIYVLRSAVREIKKLLSV